MTDTLALMQDPRMRYVVLAISAWELAWKGVALWYAARSGSRNFFVALLLFNTLGILPILYIYVFRKRAQGKKHKS